MTDIVKIKARIGGADGAVKTFKGRTAWALSQLLNAGESGCTPITHPGPRWSDYVFKLRRDGVVVETTKHIAALMPATMPGICSARRSP